MKKQSKVKLKPKAIIKTRIKQIDELECRLKTFKEEHGYCAENTWCVKRPPKGQYGCDSCLADVDPRR